MLTACPDCGSSLGRGASKCRCGWKASAAYLSAPKANCAYVGCLIPALLRKRVETGWANFCEYHYIQDHTQRAAKWCEDNGLHTTQQKIEFCRRMAGTLFRPIPKDREPGQDDEELAA
jgi:hypothetical protein